MSPDQRARRISRRPDGTLVDDVTMAAYVARMGRPAPAACPGCGFVDDHAMDCPYLDAVEGILPPAPRAAPQGLEQEWDHGLW